MDVQYLKYADITLTDGTVLNLTSADLWQNGLRFEDSVSSDSSFDIGSAIVNVLDLSINNFDEKYSDYDFEGAEVVTYIGLELDDGTTEKIRICTMTVVEQPEDETVTIDLTCEDNMRKFDRNYSDSKLKYPATRGQIVRDACEVCGVTLQTTSFDRDDYIVQTRPDDDALTFRQVLQWVAQIGCQWLRCDEYGRLNVGWYSNFNEIDMTVDENGVLKAKNENLLCSDETVYAEKGIFVTNDGTLRLYATDGKGNISEIDSTYGFTPQHTDVVITGVKVTEYSDSTDEEPESYMSGTEGYMISVSDNKLIRKGDGQTVASIIGEKCIGMVFRPFESECPTDVALEAGDSILIKDRNGKLYNSYLTTTTLKPGAGQQIACNAKSAAKNSSTRYSQITQVYVTARKMIKAEKTAREKALEEFGKRIDSATGVYTTVEPQEDGSKIFYLHDKPTLAESQAVWKMTSEAWGVSTDGGQTWNGGMTVDGDTIVRILNAVGVNASWINAGAITVKDADGNILFQVDMDTKKVIISGDYVIIGGKTATKALSDNLQESKNYSDGKLADYADTVTKSLSGLQAQIDGQIETFFYDYEPSLQNLPASEWTSTEERKKHEGDLFYWKTTGYAYRFMQEGATWKWQLIQDNDISKALAQAEKAQDTADGKRRTFVVQPSPPYDIGDLWSQDGGDILTCVVSRAEGSIYASSDWKKLNKYTDDTVANEALKAAGLARNMTLQLSNEVQVIASDAEGNIPTFPVVSTQATVMYGTQDITDDCSFTITKSDSVTGSWSNATHIYNATGLSADNGWVDIKAVYLNALTITKRFSVSKQKSGTPGRTYVLESSTTILKRESENSITPNIVTFSAYYRDGKNTGRTDYAGRFVIEETSDGKTWETAYSSVTDETSVNYYVDYIFADSDGVLIADSDGSLIGARSKDIIGLRCSLYASGGTTNLIDTVKLDVITEVTALTQDDILKLLTNDGQWKGIYKGADGEVYFSFSAAMGGLLKLGGKNNGNGVQKVYDSDGNLISTQDINGYFLYNADGLIKASINKDSIRLYDTPLNPNATSTSSYEGIELTGYGFYRISGAYFFDDNGEISIDIELGNEPFVRLSEADEGNIDGNFYDLFASVFEALDATIDNVTIKSGTASLKKLYLPNIATGSGLYYLWVAGDGTVCRQSSSSERYKDIGNVITPSEIEEWYKIEPIWAKYKDGYLMEGDENEGRYLPMFIAEDVEEHFPEAVMHVNGQVEDWNYRMMIPAMFAMLKQQKSEIDNLKDDIKELRKIIKEMRGE